MPSFRKQPRYYLLLFLLLIGCTSISKHSVSVVSNSENDHIYVLLPFARTEATYAGGYPLVQDNGVEGFYMMVYVQLVDLGYTVVDRQLIVDTLERFGFGTFGDYSYGHKQEVAYVLKADVVITGMVTDYNASRASFSIVATDMSSGTAVWAADATAKTSWISLNTERAAQRAVDRVFAELRRELIGQSKIAGGQGTPQSP